MTMTEEIDQRRGGRGRKRRPFYDDGMNASGRRGRRGGGIENMWGGGEGHARGDIDTIILFMTEKIIYLCKLTSCPAKSNVSLSVADRMDAAIPLTTTDAMIIVFFRRRPPHLENRCVARHFFRTMVGTYVWYLCLRLLNNLIRSPPHRSSARPSPS